MSLGPKAIDRVGAVFERADLGDPRLVRRAVGLAQALAEAPDLSLPKVWATPAELEAGYRFLRNPRTGFTELMEPVQQTTREAALEAGRVLVIHDTTDLECASADPDEVGYLNTGRPGFFVHHALCVRDDATTRPLGIAWSQLWGRPQRTRRTPGKKVQGSELAKREERESDRWLEGVTEAALWTEGCQSVVHVMDREADALRVFELLDALETDFVLRLRHDRPTDEGHVSSELAHAEIRFTRQVPLSPRAGKAIPNTAHPARSAREASLVVRAQRLRMKPPNYFRTHEPVEINVVQVLEEDAPDGIAPVAWVLATSLPIETKAQVARVLDVYRARWQIEELHKALKTGCLVERRQLESFESITTLLAISYPVACELLRLRARARENGALAQDVLRPSLLACLRAHPKARTLSDNPSALEALGAIAGLGGHQKHNGPPGWQTLAAGMMRLRDFEQGWLAARGAQDL